jgi:small subunit ribosomal protein S8
MNEPDRSSSRLPDTHPQLHPCAPPEARRARLEAEGEIARILKEEGYIANYKPTEENGMKVLRVYLKYGPNNEAVIRDLQRVSRPGCRVYLGRDEIKRVQGGLGISIMTTPKGVMTGRQARREGVGGEILCEVW